MNPPHLAINPRNDNMSDIMSNAKINLGSILSLSGEASQDARGIRDGIELAIKKLRDSNQDVAIHYIDDNSDVVTSVRSIEALVREHKVSVIIGPTWAHQVDSFAPIIDQEKIITFAPAVASDSIIKNSKYLLFGAERNMYKQSALKDFVINNKVKNIGVILSQDKWGVSHLLPIKNVALQTGAMLVFVEQIIPYISSFGKKYIRETISRALQNKPDVIIWSGYEGEADVLADFLLESGLSVPLIGDQMLVAGERGEKLKKYQGELYIFSNRFSPEFVKLFESEYKKKPTLYSDSSYDATMLLVDILSRKQNMSSDEIIQIIKGGDYQYKGISGMFVFDEQGDIQSEGRLIIERFVK